MDPVTLIVDALAAGAAAGVKDTASSAVLDAYAGLKVLARKRLGGRTDGELVLARHEWAPDTWQAPLASALAAAAADHDQDLIAAAKVLLSLVNGSGIAAESFVVDARGAYGVQVGKGNTQHIGVGAPRAGLGLRGGSGRELAVSEYPEFSDRGSWQQVDARESIGVQVGSGNFQVIHVHKQVIYSNGLTWTDRAPAQPLLAGTPGMSGSPYRGLPAFEEADAEFFFGREAMVRDVLRLMSERLEAPGLLMVSGASGAGKSSMLRAGVLAQLRWAGLPALPTAAQWQCLTFTPGEAPLDQLAVRAAVLSGADAAAVRRGLRDDPSGFALTALQAALARSPGPDQEGQLRLLIVVDQFEQLFTQCHDEAEQRAFITALHAAACARVGGRDEPPALVVLGIRADFESRCVDYPLLGDALQDRYLVLPMEELQLRTAITEPARMAGSRVDDDLADRLLREARSNLGGTLSPAVRRGDVFGAGVLPLLSHALDQAWRSRTGATLTLSDYARVGGIGGAVAQSAQRAFDQLAPGQQTAARLVFTSLTATGGDGTVTAARAFRADLVAGMDEAAAGNVETVLEAFAAERLLTLAADTVEISHEALLTAWPLMHYIWLADAQADRIVRTRLHAAADDWARRDRDPSFLYGGTLLAEAAGTVARMRAAPSRYLPLSQAEGDFFRASHRAGQNKTRRRQALIASLLVLVVGLAASTVAAIRSSDAATSELDTAVAGQLDTNSHALGSTNAPLSRLESVAAWRLDPSSPAAGYAMRSAAMLPALATLDVSVDSMAAVAFGRGSTLATLSEGGGLRLWDASTYRQIGKPSDAASATSSGTDDDAAAFSPDGGTLAAVTSAGLIQLWDMADRRMVMKPIRAGRSKNTSLPAVDSVAVSAGGKTVAATGADGTVHVWDIATRRQVIPPIATGSRPVESVAFNPAGNIIATASGVNTVDLWDALTGAPIATLPTGQASMGSSASGFVTFSPNGQILASVSGAGTVRLWDVVTRKLIGAPLAGGGPVNSVAFSPGSTILASADADGSIRLWEVATRQQITSPLNGDDGSVASVAFSHDGRLLASANSNGTVRLWDMDNLFQVATLTSGIGHGKGLSIAFGAKGRLLAATNSYGSMVWNAATLRLVGYFGQDLAYPGQAMAVSPSGKKLAIIEDDRAVLWDLATRRRIGTIIAGSKYSFLGAVAFSPVSNILALGTGNGGSVIVQLWDAATRTRIATLRSSSVGGGQVTSLAFSPDGNSIVASSASGSVVWDVASHKQIHGPFLLNAGGTNTSAMFSPDGRLLAIGNGYFVSMWRTGSWQQIGNPFASSSLPDDAIESLTFSPDSQILASGSYDGTVQLWDTATDQEIGSPLVSASTDTGQVRSLAFSPDGKTLAASSQTGAVQIWNLAGLVNIAQNLCTMAGQSLTKAEWNEYAQGTSYLETCPQYSVIPPPPSAFNSP